MAEMPSAKGQYPLGTVLFGCVPAPGCAPAPDDSAPDTWLASFAAQAGGEVFAGLYRASKSTRDSALQWAPQVALRLDLTSDEPHEVWVQRLEAAAARLRTRGVKPTALHIQCNHSPFAASLLTLLPQALQGVGAGITQLSVVFPQEHQGHNAAVQTLFLQRVTAALPSLASLSLEHCPCTLPAPPALPSLTAISVTLTQVDTAYHDLYRSLGAYLPQLQQLHMSVIPQDHPSPAPILWSAVFSHTSHTLTHFSHTRGGLCDGLITLLVKHAPALEQLSVQSLRYRDDHSDKQWAVRQIRLGFHHVTLGDLARLPSSSAGPVEVVGVSELVLTVRPEDDEVLAPSTVQRLPDWRFPEPVCTELHELDSFTHPPTTLATLLRHMADIQAPTVTLHVLSPVWTAELSQAAAAVLAAAPQLQLELTIYEQITDSVLSAVLEAGSHVRKLSVYQLCLESDTHVNTPWPWEQFSVETVQAPMLLRLPSPQGPASLQGTPVIKCARIVKIDEVTQADAERLTTWLPHVRWAPTNTHVGIQVSVPWLGSLPLTQAHLSMLRAVRFHTPAAAQKTVLILRHWHMNTSGIDLLQSLPAWAGPIWFRECTWPLKDAQYCRFGQTISTSYRMWSFGEAPIGAVQSMCAAADRVRAGLGLPRLIVYSKEHQGADRVWENVTLTGNWPQSEM